MNAIYIRLVVVALLFGLAFGAGWKVRDWKADADTLEAARQHTEAVAAAEKQKTEAEHHYTQLQASAEADRQRLIKERDDALTKARSTAAARGLYVHGTCPGNNVVPGPAAAASGGDDGTPIRLSRESASYLLDRAGQADTIADQLRECQAVIKAYRASCGSQD